MAFKMPKLEDYEQYAVIAAVLAGIYVVFRIVADVEGVGTGAGKALDSVASGIKNFFGDTFNTVDKMFNGSPLTPVTKSPDDLVNANENNSVVTMYTPGGMFSDVQFNHDMTNLPQGPGSDQPGGVPL